MATSPYLLLFKVPSRQPEHRTPTQRRTLTPQSPTCTSSALWIVIYQKFGPVREYSGIRRGDALVGGALRSACRGRSGTRARPLSGHRKWLLARKRADAKRAGEGGGVRGCGVSGSWKQQRCSQQRRERRRRRDPKRRRAVGVGVRRLYSKRGVGVGLSPRGCSSPVPVAQVTR